MALHPDLVLKSRTSTILQGGDALLNIQTCRICLDEAEDAIQSKCHHVYCRCTYLFVLVSSGTPE